MNKISLTIITQNTKIAMLNRQKTIAHIREIQAYCGYILASGHAGATIKT